MKNLHPETPVANIDEGSGSVTAAAERLAADTAALYRDDPLRAEAALRDMVFGMARSVLKDASGTPGDRGDAAGAGGGTYRRAGATPGRAMTVSGPAGFLRSR